MNDNETAGQLNIEYRSGWDDWYVKPFGGVMATTDAAIYGYAGFMLDIYFGRRFVFTPNVAVGLYSDGDGKDLGSVIEFRSEKIEALQAEIATELGYELVYHRLELYCRKRTGNAPGTPQKSG